MGDSVLTSDYALVFEPAADAKTIVDATVAIVHGLDLVVKPLVCHLLSAGRSSAPGGIAAMRDVRGRQNVACQLRCCSQAPLGLVPYGA